MTDEGDPFILPPEEEPAETAINFQSEDIDFQLDQPDVIVDWVETVISRENCQLLLLNYIFCSDNYLHQINLEYLRHDTLTDIITFPYAPPPFIQGDIFISIERVRENAENLQLTFNTELCRVMIHGVLHLCGYGDKTAPEKTIMTEKEDEALSYLPPGSFI